MNHATARLAGLAVALSTAGPLRAQESKEPLPMIEPALPEAKEPSLRDSVEGLLGVPLHGEISHRYRHRRATSGDKDEDLTQFLRFTIGDEESDAWAFDFAGRANEDLDGDRHTDGPFSFDGLSNTYNGGVSGQLYTAALTGRRVVGLDRVRLGRQEVLGAEPLTFDGLRLDAPAVAALARLQVSAYAGVPVHWYETSRSGDWLAGAEAALRPLDATTLVVQYAHISDEFSLYANPRTDVETVRWQQQWIPGLSTEARATAIDGEGREAVAFATVRAPDPVLFVQLGYRRLMEQQGAYAVDVDPYVGLLTVERPYHQGEGRASIGIAPWLTINADGVVRELVHNQDESSFNHEFTRWSVSPVVSGWPDAGTQWTLTGTVWTAPRTHLASFGGEVSQRLLPVLLVRAGSDYALYNYDFLLQTERSHARTFYLKLRWLQTKEIRWDIGYERERDDFGTFGRFDIEARYRF